MDYITTDEIAKAWGITSARVLILAKSGRIDGAKKIGKVWMIPADAVKPADARCRQSRQDNYRFPVYCFGNRTAPGQYEKFSPAEKSLLEGSRLFENGQFEEAEQILHTVYTTTDSKYTKIAALYTAVDCLVYLRRFADAENALVKMNGLLSEPDEHGAELDLLKQIIDSYYCGDTSTVTGYSFPAYAQYKTLSEEYRIFTGMWDVYAYAVAADGKNSSRDSVCYEYFCRYAQEKGYCFYAALGYIFFALHFLYTAEQDTGIYYFKKAISIAVENSIYASMAKFCSYFIVYFEEALRDFPREVRDKFTVLSEQTQSAYSDFLIYLKKNNLFSVFSGKDYLYISYIKAGYSVNEIAGKEEVSEKTVYRRLQTMYRKTGTKNREEFCTYVLNFLTDFTYR